MSFGKVPSEPGSKLGALGKLLIAGKYKVLPEVVEFVLTGTFIKVSRLPQRLCAGSKRISTQEMEDFVVQNEGKFGSKDEKEHKLEYTTIHNQFVAQFEKRLEGALSPRQSQTQVRWQILSNPVDQQWRSFTRFARLCASNMTLLSH